MLPARRCSWGLVIPYHSKWSRWLRTDGHIIASSNFSSIPIKYKRLLNRTIWLLNGTLTDTTTSWRIEFDRKNSTDARIHWIYLLFHIQFYCASKWSTVRLYKRRWVSSRHVLKKKPGKKMSTNKEIYEYFSTIFFFFCQQLEMPSMRDKKDIPVFFSGNGTEKKNFWYQKIGKILMHSACSCRMREPQWKSPTSVVMLIIDTFPVAFPSTSINTP